MKVRPYTGYSEETGLSEDMTPIWTTSQMIEGPEAVAQIVIMRLRLLRGEWWEDESLGMQIPGFLTDTVRGNNLGLISKYLAAYISETAGVASVEGAEITYEDHKATFKCTIIASDGAQPVEVNLDGIL